MNKIVLATHNLNKVKEVKEILKDHTIISLKDLGITPKCKESGISFEENSLIKAREITAYTSYPVIADDSGLCIDALNGFPGIYSARFLEDKTYAEKNKEIINILKDTKNRKAHFTSAISFIDKENNIEKTFIGIAEGIIIDEYKDSPNGFGYDPIFYSNELKKTFGEATKEEKNSVSHRYKALKKLSEYLKREYETDIRNR